MPNLIGQDIVEWLKNLDAQTQAEALKQSRPANVGGMGQVGSPGKMVVPRVETPGVSGMGVNPAAAEVGTAVKAAQAGSNAGVFANAAGQGPGAFLRNTLSKLAHPVVQAGVALGLKPAWDLGRKAGEAYNNAGKVDSGAVTGGLPSLAELGYPEGAITPVAKSTPQVAAQPLTSSSPQVIATQSAKREQPLESQPDYPMDESSVNDHFPDLGISAEELARLQGGEVAAKPGVHDEIANLINTLFAEQKGPTQEAIKPDTAKVANELAAGKPPVDPKKETFGHKIKRFIVAGSGPVDFSRIDKQEAEAEQARQAFTDPQKFSAEMAGSEIKGAQQFNRASQLQHDAKGGMTPQSKFILDLLGGQIESGQKLSNAKEMAGIEHQNRMAEIGASGANQKLSPEQQQRQFTMSMMEKNPDLFYAQDVSRATGLPVSPEALKVLQDARLKNDPMAMIVTEMLKERLGKMKGSAGSTPAQITTKALSNAK